MGAEIVIVQAREDHARALAPNMRAADAAEVLASDGYTPLDALLVSLDRSSYSRTMLIGGEVAAMWGCAKSRTFPGAAEVWALTSTVVDRHPIAFAKQCRRELAAIRERYPCLVQVVDARYARAIRWAKWLGFFAGEPAPGGRRGEAFQLIHIGRVSAEARI